MMRFRRRRGNAGQWRQRASGFSLLEISIVLSLSIVAALVSVISLVPVINQQHVTNAYNTTMAAMRQARDNAISQRTSYSVTFSNSVSPNTIVVAPTLAGFQGDQSTATYQLPSDVTFQVQSGLSTTPPPDGYGVGTAPIDLGMRRREQVRGGRPQFTSARTGRRRTRVAQETARA